MTDRRALAAEIALYVALAAVGVAPAVLAGRALAGDGVDLYGTVWFFWWIRDCVEHLADPSYTTMFFYPMGKDIFAHTGNNFVDAVFSLPFQWLFGHPGWYPWWIGAVILGNALAFRPLAREELGPGAPSIVATALFATNPFVLVELQCGRPTQAFLWFLPLALWYLRRLEQPRDAVFAGIAAAAVGWSYWFNGFFFAFAAVWIVGLELWDRRADPAALRRFGLGLLLAATVGALIVAPGVALMALRKAHDAIPGVQDHHRGWFELPDVAGRGAPTLQGYVLTEPEGVPYLHRVAWALALPLWLVLGPARRRWLPVVVIALVLATGLEAKIGGVKWPMYPYIALYNELPFFDRLWFPYRALTLVFLAGSLGVGAVAGRLGALAGRWGDRFVAPATLGVGALVLGGTLVELDRDEMFPFRVRDATTPAVYTWMAPQGGAIIDLPPRIAQNYILYQPDHQLPLFGGMGENVSLFWPKGYKERNKNLFVAALTKVCRDPKERATFAPRDRKVIVDQGFAWVVLHRELVDSEFNREHAAAWSPAQIASAPFQITERLTEMLGPPIAVDGPMVVWSLRAAPAVAPAALAPTPERIGARIWDRPEPLPYERRLYELGRIR